MDIREMLAVVQAYINHHKGVTIDINIQQFNHPLAVVQLQDMYAIAMDFFRNDPRGSIMLINNG